MESVVKDSIVKNKKVELLAPAGNKEGFYGAIHAGADAVYLGGDKFGARAYADNFTTEELVACIRYAHVWGRKVYLTVNTLVKDKEWDQLYDYIMPFYEAGLDGVIIQDLGVFLYLKEHFPGMELHVSTQMTLTGSYGAAYMKALGACRIVPARELSLAEVRTIKEDTGLEIEAFIHGAMCYCYSGQCLFSSVLGGRSGNRGRCAQPCRLPYSVAAPSQETWRQPDPESSRERDRKYGSHKELTRSEECFPLSLKDMCTIENIPELIASGIDSFKIEGRMKKPEYAAGVTSIYRKAIDRYYANPQGYKVYPEELKALSGLYIRSERQNGYYHKHNGADMVTLHSPAYSGSDDALLAQIRKDYLEQKPTIPVTIYAGFTVGAPASLTFVCAEHSVTVTGDLVQPAQKQPISQENVEKQLKKLGETSFCAANILVELDENAFYPLKSINELRRQAVLDLEDMFIQGYGLCGKRNMPEPTAGEELFAAESIDKQPDKQLTVNVRTLDQLYAVADFIGDQNYRSNTQLRRLYVEGDLLVGTHAKAAVQCLMRLADHVDIYPVLPYIIRKRDRDYLNKLFDLISAPGTIYRGCMVRSLEGYAYLIKQGYQGKVSSDAGFYIWNQQTLMYWKDRLDSFCLPWELNAGEQRVLLEACHKGCAGEQHMHLSAGHKVFAEKIVYGHLPMMLTANCVVRTTSGCLHAPDANNITYLTDRYKKKFPVALNCNHCMNIIYNSVPLSLHGTMDRWMNITHSRLDFTVEDYQKTGQILAYFAALTEGRQPTLPFTEYTNGHEKRGVE